MIKKYLSDMRLKNPHERRQSAMRIAGTLTAVVFVAWAATLATRLGAPTAKTAAEMSGFTSQMASVFGAFSGNQAPNTLEPATTTQY